MRVNAKRRDLIARAAGATRWSRRDLRRTFATGLGASERSRFAVGKALNHVPASAFDVLAKQQYVAIRDRGLERALRDVGRQEEEYSAVAEP